MTTEIDEITEQYLKEAIEKESSNGSYGTPQFYENVARNLARRAACLERELRIEWKQMNEYHKIHDCNEAFMKRLQESEAQWKEERKNLLHRKLSDDVLEMALHDCIETSCTAFDVLKKHKMKAQDADRAIANVLLMHIIPIPDGFPGSDACVEYGKAIANYILEQLGYNKQKENGAKS